MTDTADRAAAELRAFISYFEPFGRGDLILRVHDIDGPRDLTVTDLRTLLDENTRLTVENTRAGNTIASLTDENSQLRAWATQARTWIELYAPYDAPGRTAFIARLQAIAAQPAPGDPHSATQPTPTTPAAPDSHTSTNGPHEPAPGAAP